MVLRADLEVGLSDGVKRRSREVGVRRVELGRRREPRRRMSVRRVLVR